MLTRTLKDLRRDGLVWRTSRREEHSLTVNYGLTAMGAGAGRLIATLTDWISDNLDDVQDARRRHDVAQSNASSADGREGAR